MRAAAGTAASPDCSRRFFKDRADRQFVWDQIRGAKPIEGDDTFRGSLSSYREFNCKLMAPLKSS